MSHELGGAASPSGLTALQEADVLAGEAEYLSQQLVRLFKELLTVTGLMALLLLYSAVRDLAAIVSITLVVLLVGYLAGVLWRCGAIRRELRAMRRRMAEIAEASRHGSEEQRHDNTSA